MKKRKIPPKRSQMIAMMAGGGIIPPIDRDGAPPPDIAAMLAEVEMWRRRIARLDWCKAQSDKLHAAQEAADAAWDRLLAPYDGMDMDDIPNIPDPPEQAEVDQIWAEMQQVIDHDRWPRHLHWTL